MLGPISLFRVFRRTGHNFLQDEGFTVASSIAFFLLLSFVPFSSLCLLVFSTIQKTFFADSIWGAEAVRMLAEQVSQAFPFVSERWLKAHVLRPPTGSFQVINLLLLPIVSGFIFQTLENAYRKIFHLKPRHLLFGQAVYALGSIFLVAFLFVINFVWIILSTAALQAGKALGPHTYLGMIYETLRQCITPARVEGVSLLVLVAFHLVSVKIFLNLQVRLRHRLLCALVFAVAWGLARVGYGWYITHVARINFLYGSLSSLVVVLLWVYYSSLALLFSVEMLYVLHTSR